MDHFIYIPRNVNEMENGNEDVQWEFFVIGKRVSWNEAESICPAYGHLNPLSVSEEQKMGYDGFLPDPPTRETETDTGSTLAVFDEDTKDWLARMLSESNYRSFCHFTFLFFRHKKIKFRAFLKSVDLIILKLGTFFFFLIT